jgi:hypothetical protein
MFEENPLLAFSPCDIVRESVDLDLLAVGYGCEEVEEGTDFRACQRKDETRIG